MLGCSTCGNREPWCDACAAALADQLAGVAACRGALWGEAVRRAMPGQTWPRFDDAIAGRMRAIAYRKVADLGADARVHDRLARICVAAAERAYHDGPANMGMAFRVDDTGKG